MTTKEKLDIDHFVREQPAKLAELRARVEPRYGPLDLSYESLDRLEAFYRDVLEGAVPGIDEKALRQELARYVGETLASHTGGTWASGGEGARPQPVVKVPGLKRVFEPDGPVLDFRRLRIPGFVRRNTEEWDLPLRRAELEALVKRRDAELEQLRADIERLTGKRVAKLDASERSLGLVEQALKNAVAREVDPESRRALQRRATLLVGSLFADAIGSDGTWSVNSDPDDVEFGEFQVAGWTPLRAFDYFKADTPAGTLHTNLATEIKNKKARKK